MKVWTAVALLTVALGACSPYAYQQPIKAFTTGTDDLTHALAASPAATRTDHVALQTAEWRDTRPSVAVTGGCDPFTQGICGLVVKKPTDSSGSAIIAARQRLDQSTPTALVAAAVADASAPACVLPPGAEGLPTNVTATPHDVAAQLQVAKALLGYAKALSAVTNAADRTAYDAASADLATSVGELAGAVGTLAGPSGAAAGPAAKALTGAVTLVGGTILDQRRYTALRSAVEAACIPVRTLADAAAVLLSADWNQRLVDRRRTADQLARGLGPNLPAKVYAERLLDTQAAVAALATLKSASPTSAASALRDAHDALVVALRDDTRAQTLAALGTAAKFADEAKAVRDALGTTK